MVQASHFRLRLAVPPVSQAQTNVAGTNEYTCCPGG